MSKIEIVALRPFTTIDVKGDRVEKTLISYRVDEGPISSTTREGTINTREAAEREIRGA